METKKPILMNQGHTDHMQTPSYALNPLYPYIKKEWVIWEPACGKGNLVNALKNKGYRVFGTDIDTNDFLKYETALHYDAIITNPPYTIKDRWIQRCYELDKPFALLMPLTALEGKFRGELYSKHGIQLLIPNRRINFETPNGGSSSWFQTVWFCYQFNLSKDLMFVKMNYNTDTSIHEF